jgi:hypothetical protein
MQGWMLGAPVPCDAEGYRRNDCSTLAPDEIGDSLSVSLYTVPEIARTVQVRNPCFDTPFCLPFFHLKPRQARDKCNAKKGVSHRNSIARRQTLSLTTRARSSRTSASAVATSAMFCTPTADRASSPRPGVETHAFCGTGFYNLKRSVAKTGSGRT